MLPINSPRWSKLKSAMGGCEEIAAAIGKMYQTLELSDLTDSQLAESAREMEIECEELYHQQSVYSGTAAAIPHLVEIAGRLPTSSKISLLLTVAYWVYEGPDYRTDEEDLLDWYSTAVSQAEALMLQLAKMESELSETDQVYLFTAISIFRGLNNTFYAIREHDCIEYRCGKCDLDLYALFDDRKFFVIRTSDSTYPYTEIPESVRSPVTPTDDLASELQNPYHAEFKFMTGLIIEGRHGYMHAWLEQLLGRYDCPECNTSSQIRHVWNDNGT